MSNNMSMNRFNLSNYMSNMQFRANSLLDVTNMQNMQNNMHNMHNMQSWFQYVEYALLTLLMVHIGDDFQPSHQIIRVMIHDLPQCRHKLVPELLTLESMIGLNSGLNVSSSGFTSWSNLKFVLLPGGGSGSRFVPVAPNISPMCAHVLPQCGRVATWTINNVLDLQRSMKSKATNAFDGVTCPSHFQSRLRSFFARTVLFRIQPMQIILYSL
jgi:hypothetical protein